jgi:hypothetical protein
MDRQAVEILLRIEKRLARIERFLSAERQRLHPKVATPKKKVAVPRHL